MSRRRVGTIAAGVLFLLGCSGGNGTDEAAEGFAFRAPDPPCPPPSALETRPLADKRSDLLFEPALTIHTPTLFEDDDHLRMACSYGRDGDEEAEEATVEELALASAEISLFPTWEDSPNSQVAAYVELPVDSEDLADWEGAAVITGDPRVLRGSCGGSHCQEGEEPTIRSYMLHWKFSGHVENLDFTNVEVTYQVEHLPVEQEAELVPQVVTIFRDLVMAVLDTYERAD